MSNQATNQVLNPLPQEPAQVLHLQVAKAKLKPKKRSLYLYQCHTCGRRLESEDWVFCSKGHKEVGVARVESLGKSERAELLAHPKGA